MCRYSLVDALTSPDLTVSALEELMRGFVRDAEAGTHEARGWPSTCYGVSKMGARGEGVHSSVLASTLSFTRFLVPCSFPFWLD